MGKNNYILFVLLVVSDCLFAQKTTNFVLIEFKDKSSGLCNSHEIDLPVSETYIKRVENLGFTFKSASTWLNTGVFTYNDADILVGLSALSFIEKVTFDCVSESKHQNILSENETMSEQRKTKKNDGNSVTDNNSFYLSQIQQINGNYLQDLGFKGNGIKIAVIDAGFPNANNLGALQHIYESNRLLGRYDFYQNDSNVYTNSTHGTSTFSIIGGLKSDFSGAAPEASFYLFRTEVTDFEGQTEEVFLAQALERCAQLGVNVASISLGYENNGGNGFNDGTQSHTWADMNGHTTIAAKAVNIAASKGILVCVSAGNEGSSPWKYIVTPADADSAFTIGGVDLSGNIYPATGYNFDTSFRVKPNVSACGLGTSFINQSNNVQTGSGTSFACPIIAGMSACLWQAFPSKTNWEIKTAIEQSASLYLSPSKRLGYGIPDFQKAYNLLATPTLVTNKSLENEFSVFPNPFLSTVNIISKGNTNIERINVINNIGQIIYTINAPTENTLALNDLPDGMYVLQIETDKGLLIKKLIKE